MGAHAQSCLPRIFMTSAAIRSLMLLCSVHSGETPLYSEKAPHLHLQRRHRPRGLSRNQRLLSPGGQVRECQAVENTAVCFAGCTSQSSSCMSSASCVPTPCSSTSLQKLSSPLLSPRCQSAGNCPWTWPSVSPWSASLVSRTESQGAS